MIIYVWQYQCGNISKLNKLFIISQYQNFKGRQGELELGRGKLDKLNEQSEYQKMLTLFRDPSQVKVQPIIPAKNFFIRVFNEFNKINKCTVL